jgi:hypothetical protein
MLTRHKLCDSCRVARASVETDAGFFLCDPCEDAVVITFQEFELPSGLPRDCGLDDGCRPLNA